MAYRTFLFLFFIYLGGYDYVSLFIRLAYTIKYVSKCICYKEKRIANEFERLTSAGRKQQTGKTMRFF